MGANCFMAYLLALFVRFALAYKTQVYPFRARPERRFARVIVLILSLGELTAGQLDSKLTVSVNRDPVGVRIDPPRERDRGLEAFASSTMSCVTANRVRVAP
jgi:hypothetical protein